MGKSLRHYSMIHQALETTTTPEQTVEPTFDFPSPLHLSSQLDQSQSQQSSQSPKSTASLSPSPTSSTRGGSPISATPIELDDVDIPAGLSPVQSLRSPGHSPHVRPRLKPTILLVEDVRVSQRIYQAALARSKKIVEVASTGEEAIEKFKQNQSSLQLILMDIQLPRMSGIEATELIREYEKENSLKPVCILGLTGSVGTDDLKRYRSAGMNGCIAKGELLCKSIDDALAKLVVHPEEFVCITEVGSSNPKHMKIIK